MILIQNGRVVDPVTGTDQVMDVLLDGSVIVKTGQGIQAAEAEVIDASGLVVAPGLVDAHVHFRDPGFTYKEDILSGARAAARGGFTTVICMANKAAGGQSGDASVCAGKGGRGGYSCAAGGCGQQGAERRRADRYGSAGGCGGSGLYR